MCFTCQLNCLQCNNNNVGNIFIIIKVIVLNAYQDMYYRMDSVRMDVLILIVLYLVENVYHVIQHVYHVME